MNPLTLPLETVLQATSNLPTKHLPNLMRASSAWRTIGELTLRDRLTQCIDFWQTHYANGPESSLGRLILAKLKIIFLDQEQTQQHFTCKKTVQILAFSRLAWSVMVSIHPTIITTNQPHPSGQPWPILIIEMTNPSQNPHYERNRQIVIDELAKLNLARNDYLFYKDSFTLLAEHNPAMITLGEAPETLTICYMNHKNRFRRWPIHIGAGISYHQLVDMCFNHPLRESKPGPRQPFFFELLKKRDHVDPAGEKRATESLKRLRFTPDSPE